jgi:hypothetical protein
MPSKNRLKNTSPVELYSGRGVGIVLLSGAYTALPLHQKIYFFLDTTITEFLHKHEYKK